MIRIQLWGPLYNNNNNNANNTILIIIMIHRNSIGNCLGPYITASVCAAAMSYHAVNSYSLTLYPKAPK